MLVIKERFCAQHKSALRTGMSVCIYRPWSKHLIYFNTERTLGMDDYIFKEGRANFRSSGAFYSILSLSVRSCENYFFDLRSIFLFRDFDEGLMIFFEEVCSIALIRFSKQFFVV